MRCILYQSHTHHLLCLIKIGPPSFETLVVSEGHTNEMHDIYSNPEIPVCFLSSSCLNFHLIFVLCVCYTSPTHEFSSWWQFRCWPQAKLRFLSFMLIHPMWSASRFNSRPVGMVIVDNELPPWFWFFQSPQLNKSMLRRGSLLDALAASVSLSTSSLSSSLA